MRLLATLLAVLVAVPLGIGVTTAAAPAEPSWTAVGVDTTQRLRGLDAVDGDTAWVGGSDGGVTRIAVYPLLLLPNTEYAEDKERFGLRTVRGEYDDFEYVLAHRTMTIAENLEMKRFILWARAVAEHLVLRHVWAPLRELAGLSQSAVIRDMIKWFEASAHPGAVRLTQVAARVQRQPSKLPVFLRELYGEPALDDLLAQWWSESVGPQLPPEYAPLLHEVFRYDCLTRPILDMPDRPAPPLPVVLLGGESHYHRERVGFDYDVPAVLEDVARGRAVNPRPSRTYLSLYHRTGFHKYYGNHEEGIYFVGLNEREVDDVPAPPVAAAPPPESAA